MPMAPRARGALRLVAKRRGANTVIAALRQEGSLKALFPKVRGAALDAVFLNTAGGLTGGDQMRIEAVAGEGAHVVLSSQAAERAYRAQPGQVAQSNVILDVAAGGRIDWLPQETILFDQAALNRTLQVALAKDATALIIEPIIFGRVAMGEQVHKLHLTDQWRIWRDGKLAFADAIRLVGDAQMLMARHAIAGGAGAVATVLFASPMAAAFADNFDLPPTSGISLIADDILLLRLLAADGFTLRQQLIPVVEALSAAPIPRVWRL
ncbi:MAG: urease accessory protein UreD [Pseudomonadota bacterium]